MKLVYRYRVKSLHGELGRQARAVNYVWNYCNDAQKHAAKWGRKWLTAYDLINLTAGAGKDLRLASVTVAQTCQQYAKSRFQQRKPSLRYRGRKSLGWVPLRGYAIKSSGDSFRFNGYRFRVFNPRPLPGKICDGSNFSQDARGNWFLNVVVDVADAIARQAITGVGIDLGLRDLATLSTGEKVANPRHMRQIEARLAIAQRARRKRQATKLHAKAGSARRDFLHKLSTRIAREFDYIAVGNVNASGLAKTSMAKSVHDASWSSFRNMLRYKAIAHGATYEEVDESFSSQVCSACGCLPASRPKGIADLGIREWTCSDCGAIHDRDVNAARNILRSGRRAPVEGISAIHA